MNIGKAIVPTLEAERQAGVIHPQQMQQRGVEIVYMHWVLDDIEAKFIGLPVHMAPRMPPPASHMQYERLW